MRERRTLFADRGIPHPPARKDLIALLADVQSRIRMSENGYRTQSLLFSFFSWLTRSIAVFLLAAGIILPYLEDTAIAKSVFDGASAEDILHYAYVCLALAGIALLIDQVFVHTDTWFIAENARLSAAAIGDRIAYFRRKLELELAPGDPDAVAAWAGKTNEAIKAAEKDLTDLRKAVTTKRADLVRSGLAALRQRVEDESTQARDAVAKLESGAILVAFAEPDRMVSAEVTCAGSVAAWEKGTRTMVFDGLLPGIAPVTVRASLDTGPFAMSYAPLVEAKTTETVDVEFPAAAAPSPGP